jgi:hypothetical protein
VAHDGVVTVVYVSRIGVHCALTVLTAIANVASAREFKRIF